VKDETTEGFQGTPGKGRKKKRSICTPSVSALKSGGEVNKRKKKAREEEDKGSED